MAAPSASSAREAFAHCVRTVRTADFEGYVCTLALPAAARPAAFAVRALNVETAGVLEASGSPNLALMRFRWWRDAVAGACKGEPPAHPVAQALAAAGGAAELKPLLSTLIVSRESDVETGGVVPSLEALEMYARGSHGSVLQAVLRCSGAAGREEAGPAHAAAAHVGQAVGLVATLRGAAAHHRQRRCYLPGDVVRAHGLSHDAIVAGAADPAKLAAAVADVAAAAERRLEEARAMRGELPPGAAAALLPATPASQWLRALRTSGYDLNSPAMERGGVPPIRTQAGVLWARLTGKY